LHQRSLEIWSKNMKHFLSMAVVAGTVVLMPLASVQRSAAQSKPSPYTGVSQPPADDPIVAQPDMPPPTPAPAPAVTPVPAPAPVSAAPPVVAASAPAAVSPESNPDYGIVTSVPGSAPAPTGEAAALHTRSSADEGIVQVVHSSANELAGGTNINIRMAQDLSTESTVPGSAFSGTVANDVYKEGRVIIPAGSELRGRVTSVRQGSHFGQPSTIRLRPDVVILPDGTAYHLYAQVVGTQAPNTRTDSEGGIIPRSHLKKNTIEYGAGAGTGAVAGAELAGPPGALVGTLVGAGVVSAHLLMQHPQIAEVPKDAIVTFSLTEPMGLTPTKN
jgi:type IV secretory pathway VirB10-like protein